MPEIVARYISTVVREFQAGAALAGPSLRAKLSGEKPLRDDVEIFKLLEELIVEECDVCRGHYCCG